MDEQCAVEDMDLSNADMDEQCAVDDVDLSNADMDEECAVDDMDLSCVLKNVLWRSVCECGGVGRLGIDGLAPRVHVSRRCMPCFEVHISQRRVRRVGYSHDLLFWSSNVETMRYP
uniref:Uncharacterized protein n=1 Tax=Dunaliella tertiolecta TaxID=3047 RepID=A0A7S3VQ75_DUNTE|eukprot:1145360-Pelagomonas_calceolata.AAC.3